MAEAQFLAGILVRGEFNGSGIDTLRLPDGKVKRSHLVADNSTKVQLPLQWWRKASDYLHLPASAGGDFALIAGTFGTDSPIIQGQSASGGSVTDNCRILYVLPPEYIDGSNITLRLSTRVDVAANTSATIDAEAHEVDQKGSVGSALISASTQSINSTSFADKDFTIDGTNLVTGGMIDIQLTAVVDDTGGTSGSNAEIGATELLIDVKG